MKPIEWKQSNGKVEINILLLLQALILTLALQVQPELLASPVSRYRATIIQQQDTPHLQ